MEVQVTTLSRRGSALMRRTWRVSARRVRFGRGTGNEIPLPDIRVDLTAAAMFTLGGGITLEGLGPSPVRVNGASAKAGAVKPGDEIMIGPYQIRLGQPGPGVDAALTIELVQPLGDSLNKLTSSSRIGLERAGISKRRAAWAGFLTILLISLLLPVIVYMTAARQSAGPTTATLNPTTLVSLLWNPGSLSNSHRFFAANCKTCHTQAFARVPDGACVGCHDQVGRHIPENANLGGMHLTLETSRCTDCHKEHRGADAIVINDARLCLGCHATMAETTPGAGISDIGGFPTGHPQFRATVVSNPVGPVTERALLGSAPPFDHPGIKFSHQAHLVPVGFPALGIKPLDCSNCHVAEPGGKGFQPITYKGQCASCHALDFDRQDLPWPNARVPHGDDTGIIAAVWNYFAGKALLQGDRSSESPAAAVTRRAPGAPLREASELTGGNTRDWVTEKTKAVIRTIVLDDKRGCAYCHYGTQPDGSFTPPDLTHLGESPQTAATPARMVGPVALQTRFLPHARFDHSKHSAVDCEHCHAAGQAAALGQLMIPAVETCAQCHGAERASLRAQSTCTTCHRFHDGALGTMHGASAAAQ